MNEESILGQPVRFNPFKHHRNYILGKLETASPEMIITLLSPVCNNYVDIYTGLMTPEMICNSVIATLKSKEIIGKDDFINWLGSEKGYRLIELEDRSVWIVRKSEADDCYIHLHPARTGPLTFRIKGSTLKTICLLKLSLREFQPETTLEVINRIRTLSGLSPVKKLDRNKGILKCYEQFF